MVKHSAGKRAAGEAEAGGIAELLRDAAGVLARVQEQGRTHVGTHVQEQGRTHVGTQTGTSHFRTPSVVGCCSTVLATGMLKNKANGRKGLRHALSPLQKPE